MVFAYPNPTILNPLAVVIVNYIANAGISTGLTVSSGIMTSDIEKPRLRVFDVNVMRRIYSIRLFLHHYLKHTSTSEAAGSYKGNIIITGSEGGPFALPSDLLYSSSKTP